MVMLGDAIGLLRRCDRRCPTVQMIVRMNDPPLHFGDMVKCPHCRRWHPAVKWHTEGTDYTLNMLYFDWQGAAVLRGTRVCRVATIPARS